MLDKKDKIIIVSLVESDKGSGSFYKPGTILEVGKVSDFLLSTYKQSYKLHKKYIQPKKVSKTSNDKENTI